MKNARSRIQEHHSLLIRSFSSKIPKHVFHHLSLEGCEVNLENAANSPSDVPDESDPPPLTHRPTSSQCFGPSFWFARMQALLYYRTVCQ
ncbi:hypothetical protein TNIN_283671 [Trichonephila inaurata madagascariensis]|uniref:Uncharacterized protein n=1 Tax=Trichonephila inaurata madagascariensis TaxID=2747483 RepID=A0A8X6YVI2_9ARAC|nr:hypothetical protein TNIN_283671 [Trichonephila inaurata madagascariensis]